MIIYPCPTLVGHLYPFSNIIHLTTAMHTGRYQVSLCEEFCLCICSGILFCKMNPGIISFNGTHTCNRCVEFGAQKTAVFRDILNVSSWAYELTFRKLSSDHSIVVVVVAKMLVPRSLTSFLSSSMYLIFYLSLIMGQVITILAVLPYSVVISRLSLLYLIRPGRKQRTAKKWVTTPLPST